jgi:ribose transport system substrate-binding protein
MKKGFVFFVVLLISVGILFSAGQKEDDGVRKYALVLKTLNNPNAALMSMGARDAAEELGAEVVVMAPEREVDSAQQLEIVENLIIQGIDALLLMPSGSVELVAGVKKANEAGIPVFNIDTKMDPDAMAQSNAFLATFIGSDNFDAGYQGGMKMAELLDGEGEIAIIQGVPGHESSYMRVDGFEAAIAQFPGLKVVAKQPANWETELGYTVIQNIMEANPNLAGVWVASDLMGIGGAQAIKDAGKAGVVRMVGVDGMLAAMEGIQEGIYDATVKQSTYMMGYMGVKAASDFLDGKTLEEITYTPLTMVDKDNVDEVIIEEREMNARAQQQ